jgi:hypothetical protein
MSGIVQSVPCTADIFCFILLHHLSYNHSWFIHQSSRVATETSSSKAGIWREISVYFIGRFLCHNRLRYSTCRKILRHGADGFTSPPKEVVLLIFMTLKIHCLRLRLNPWTLGRMANTIDTIPQRTTETNSVAQEPEGSSPHSQQPATGPRPEPVESNPPPRSQSP